MEAYRTPDERFDGLPGYDFTPQLRRAGRPAHALPRRRLGHAGPPAARRADLVVPLPQDHSRAHPVRTRDRPRLLRLRPLRQAAPARGLLVRLPRGLDRPARGGARPARPHRRRPGLGRADRPPPRRRAPGPRCAARDHEHRYRRRPASVRGVAPLPRLRPPRRHGPHSRKARPHLGSATDGRRGRGGLQRAVAGARVESGHPRLPRSGPDLARAPRHTGAPGRARDSSAAGRSPRSCSSRDSDPIFSPRVAERIAEHIPGALEPEIVEGAGHFLQEDKGAEIGRRIAAFVSA